MTGREVNVTGGAYGHAAQVAVTTDELERLASMCSSAHHDVEMSANALAAALSDVQMELARCTPYAPFASAKLEWGLLSGAAGAWLRAVKFDALAASVRFAARAYDDTDAAIHSLMAGLEDSVDEIATAGSIAIGVGAGVALAAGYAGSRDGQKQILLVIDGRRTAMDVVNHALPDLSAKGMRAVNSLNPGVVQHLTNGLGLLSTDVMKVFGRPLPPAKGVNASTAAAAGVIARMYRGGPARVTSVRSLGRAVAPSSVAELVSALESPPPPAPGIRRTPAQAAPAGRVDVLTREVRGADGVRRRTHVVVLPGTSLWNKPDSPAARDVRDAQANLELRAGLPTVEMKVMKDALRAAGVKAGDDIVLAGHSQGGATAVSLSRDSEFTREFNVRSVVTAGAPVGGLPVPDGVTAVHLQDGRDLVPGFDGEAPRDSANEVTMTFDGGRYDVRDRHSIPNYVGGAHAFDDAASSGSAADGARSAAVARQRLVEVGALSHPGENAQVQVTRVDLNRDV